MLTVLALDQKFNSYSGSADSLLDAVHELKELTMEKDSFGSSGVQTKSSKTSSARSVVKKALSPLPVDVTKKFLSQGLGRHPEGPDDTEVERNSYSEGTSLKPMPKLASNYIDQGTLDGGQNSGYGSVENGSAIASPGLPYSTVSKQQELPNSNSSRSGRRVKRATTKSKKKYMLRSQVSSDRALRSRLKPKETNTGRDITRQKPKETDTGRDVTKASGESSKRKGKKKSRNDLTVDEYSRIRSHLRYLMNRMNYETSLITAYSAEGWKGLSLEKLKPEKELQRATSEIVRLKLRIRDLFQHIDSICATGRLPESLFDSEGEISSEDIFCAKCASKELTLDNDIILCDGACDRGFHQFCLVPPLLKEDIPPGDEGWLCPGCDCKLYCIDFLNESQGTKLSLNDRWEKVFPEAAAASGNPDHNFGLPSDDSDDNDYNPEGPVADSKSEGNESGSDESDFTSASDELIQPSHDQQGLGFSSDDSGDNDFDPDAHDLDEEVKPESSSSDFTSDSEDLAAVVNELPIDERPAAVVHGDGDNWGRSEGNGGNDHGLHEELFSDQDPGVNGSTPVSGKRNVDRLDYKKLYDESYGNDPYDSSEDEDFTDAKGAKKRRKKSGKAALTSGNKNDLPAEDELGDKDVKQRLDDIEHAQRTEKQTPKVKDKNRSSARVPINSSPSSSSSKKIKPSTSRRLGEAVKQRLYQSFKENQYPDRATKEDLAKELGVTFQQVDKWFGNARWSFNHLPSRDASTTTSIPVNDSPVTCTTNRQLEEYPSVASTDEKCSKSSGNTPEPRAVKHDSADERNNIVSGLPASGWTTRKTK